MKLLNKISTLCSFTTKQKSSAKRLLDEYLLYGFIKKVPAELLKIEDETILLFYLKLSSININKPKLLDKEPVDWMYSRDFCYMSIQATSLEKDKTGDFLTAIKLLTGIRPNAIHLAPFTANSLEQTYAVASTKIISENIISSTLLNLGLKSQDQLKLFVTCCHILNKKVGFDLEPHTCVLSITAICNPEVFRWIKLSKEKKLFNNMPQQEMLSKKNQEKIQKEVKKITGKIARKHKLSIKKLLKSDAEISRPISIEIIHELIDKGYWNLPLSSWRGKGLPLFSHYNVEGNYPVYRATSLDNQDVSNEIYGNLTPYSFFHGVNITPGESDLHLIKRNSKAVSFYLNIFQYWKKYFNFDFVRFDFVDHVFDSVKNNKPLSDRITPGLLKSINKKFKKSFGKPSGILAERLSNDIKKYSAAGFDLLMGDDIFYKDMNNDFMHKQVYNLRILKNFNHHHRLKKSICFTLESHDSGVFYPEGDLLEHLPLESLKIRQFIARFFADKYSRRPNYETMGFMDRSYGFKEAVVSHCSLNWNSDKKFFYYYHFILDLYEKFKNNFINGKLVYSEINSSKALWIIKNSGIYILCGIKFSNRKEKFILNNFIKNILKNAHSIEQADFKNHKISPLASPINISNIFLDKLSQAFIVFKN